MVGPEMKRLFVLWCLVAFTAQAGPVRIKDIARYDGVRDNALVGYGLVMGLAGSGDSLRSGSTLQSVRNTLENFGVIVGANEIKSRNVAAVMVTASLPAFAQEGDKVDVTVSSIGDATSLTGGTLLLAPLRAANDSIYALAQGPVSVGGYQFSTRGFSTNGNRIQKNHPTVGRVTGGANIEKSINNRYIKADGSVHLILAEPDFTTVSRVIESLSSEYGGLQFEPIHAGRIQISNSGDPVPFELIARIENTQVVPAEVARVVVNERTGTIVSGTYVQIGNVVISHGALKLVIKTDYVASQPYGLAGRIPASIGTAILPDTEIKVSEQDEATYISKTGTGIAELVQSLKKLKLSTRDIIAILQALKRSGALHAELVIQ
ncbi:MAG: flagellar P-ring protein precursor FlgI [Phenylobacterium sp.]|jgi:flagellar P-ring protein precursor FlgI